MLKNCHTSEDNQKYWTIIFWFNKLHFSNFNIYILSVDSNDWISYNFVFIYRLRIFQIPTYHWNFYNTNQSTFFFSIYKIHKWTIHAVFFFRRVTILTMYGVENSTTRKMPWRPSMQSAQEQGVPSAWPEPGCLCQFRSILEGILCQKSRLIWLPGLSLF